MPLNQAGKKRCATSQLTTDSPEKQPRVQAPNSTRYIIDLTSEKDESAVPKITQMSIASLLNTPSSQPAKNDTIAKETVSSFRKWDFHGRMQFYNGLGRKEFEKTDRLFPTQEPFGNNPETGKRLSIKQYVYVPPEPLAPKIKPIDISQSRPKAPFLQDEMWFYSEKNETDDYIAYPYAVTGNESVSVKKMPIRSYDSDKKIWVHKNTSFIFQGNFKAGEGPDKNASTYHFEDCALELVSAGCIYGRFQKVKHFKCCNPTTFELYPDSYIDNKLALKVKKLYDRKYLCTVVIDQKEIEVLILAPRLYDQEYNAYLSKRSQLTESRTASPSPEPLPCPTMHDTSAASLSPVIESVNPAEDGSASELADQCTNLIQSIAQIGINLNRSRVEAQELMITKELKSKALMEKQEEMEHLNTKFNNSVTQQELSTRLIREQNELLKQRIAASKEQLERHNSLKTQIQEQVNALNTLNSANSALKTCISNLQQKLSEVEPASDACTKLQSENNALKAQTSELKKSNVDLNRKVSQLTQRLCLFSSNLSSPSANSKQAGPSL